MAALSFTSSLSLGNAKALISATKVNAAPKAAFSIVAQKKVKKTQQVVLTKSSSMGAVGQVLTVPNGYFRNYLSPQGLAKVATEGILKQVEADKQAKLADLAAVKAEAQQMATALQTIGKFVIKKKVGEENAIFGSVTSSDIVEAVNQQTGRTLDKKDIEVPTVSTLGKYQVSVKLHPEVTAVFTVDVQKQT